MDKLKTMLGGRASGYSEEVPPTPQHVGSGGGAGGSGMSRSNSAPAAPSAAATPSAEQAERGMIAEALDMTTLSWSTRVQGFAACFVLGKSEMI